MDPKSQKLSEKMAGVEGLEPPTLGLEIRCSIRLSYTPTCIFNNLGMQLGPYFYFSCPKTRDHAYASSLVTSSIILISLIGKR